LNPIHERIEDNLASRNAHIDHASSANMRNAPNVNAGFDSDHEESKEEQKQDDIFNKGKRPSVQKNENAELMIGVERVEKTSRNEKIKNQTVLAREEVKVLS
jgi:hypothetical protein